MVKPILCFALDVWGYEYSQSVEKVHIDFCKRVCCLNQSSADFYELTECGRYPIAVTYISQCIKYWLKLKEMLNNRYPKQCYDVLRILDESGRVTWASKIRQILFEYGFGFVWISNGVGDFQQFLKTFKERLIDCSNQWLHEKMTNSPKAKHYQHFYSLLNVEKYLLTDMSPQSRRILSNFRCSSHTLNVEIGRHKNIDYNLRFCDSCLKRNVFVIEDEFHFLLNCPQSDELRSLC